MNRFFLNEGRIALARAFSPFASAFAALGSYATVATLR